MTGILKILAGPVVGAVIGFFTNYIAVKMLFRPHKAYYLFGHRLPFTPGAIPKNQPRLAHAVGTVVAENLMSEEDFRAKLLSPESEEKAVSSLMEKAEDEIGQNVSGLAGSQESYDALKDAVVDLITAEVMETIRGMDVSETLEREATEAIHRKKSVSMIGFLLTDEMIQSITRPLSHEVDRFIDEDAEGYVHSAVSDRLDQLEQESLLSLLESQGVSEELLRNFIRVGYRRGTSSLIRRILKNLDVAGMIEDKINGMDVAELERLVLTVMKKELSTIVNLGLLIGFLIGCINIFV
ncbi:MAG: DUF445 domain-containing protein [Anaerovoracaceae bacterium]|jgi:uncharacterized membrane protein YheB (UPF0754 family)